MYIVGGSDVFSLAHNLSLLTHWHVSIFLHWLAYAMKADLPFHNQCFYRLAILLRLILSLWVNIICFSTYGKSLTIAAYTSHAGRIKVHNIQYWTSMYVYTSLNFLMYHRNTHRFCWNSMNRKADSGFSKFDNRTRESLS